MMSTFKQHTHQGIVTLCLDFPHPTINKLTTMVIQEFDDILSALSQSAQSVRALLITSAKSDVFIAGADIDEIARRSWPISKHARRLGFVNTNWVYLVLSATWILTVSIYTVALSP